MAVGIGVAMQYADKQVAVEPVARQPELPEQPEPVEEQPDPPVQLVEAKSLVRVRSTDPMAAIIVPVETKSPNVTFVWVYNTIQTASR